MKLSERLVPLLKKRRSKNSVIEDSCPVCWGYQQYGDTSRVVYKDKQKDVNNHFDSYCRVQKFMKENFDGMPLKKAVIENSL